ncbi:MAG: glycosyltransferase family 2 protein [Bacteroidales bacterium]|nr:glycosyltransferase family 2 protein [Bacteroidales bacterium]
MEDLISILVPVYNVRPWLPFCLESLAAQTYAPLEVILVDDGSSDGSGAVCDRFAGEDSRFRVIHQQNRGVSASRNRALSAAAGKYVLFVDADDRLHPKALEYLHAALVSGPFRMATGDYVRVTDHREWPRSGSEETLHYRTVRGEEGIKECVDRAGIEWLVVWNRLMDRSLAQEIGFDDIAQEDALFMFRLYLKLDRFVHVEFPSYAYLDRKDSLSSKPYYLSLQSDIVLNSRMIRYASGNREYQSWLLRKSFRRYLTSRYHAEETGGKKEVNALFRSFFQEFRDMYYVSPEISWKEKLLFRFLYRCPWVVRIVMKLSKN